MTPTDTFTHDIQMAIIWQGLELFASTLPDTLTFTGTYISFSGESDSGNFDDAVSPSLTSADDKWTNEAQQAVSDAWDRFKDFRFGPASFHLLDLIKEAAEHIMDTHGQDWPDWYNDDGGRGMMQFILDGEGEDGNLYHKGVCVTVWQRTVTEKQYSGVYQSGVVETTP